MLRQAFHHLQLQQQEEEGRQGLSDSLFTSDKGVQKPGRFFFQFSLGDRHFTGSSAVPGNISVKWRTGGIYRLKFLLVLNDRIKGGKEKKAKPTNIFSHRLFLHQL